MVLMSGCRLSCFDLLVEFGLFGLWLICWFTDCVCFDCTTTCGFMVVDVAWLFDLRVIWLTVWLFVWWLLCFLVIVCFDVLYWFCYLVCFLGVYLLVLFEFLAVCLIVVWFTLNFNTISCIGLWCVMLVVFVIWCCWFLVVT